MTPREAVEMALRGGRPPRTPFTVYESMLPTAPVFAALKRRGLVVVRRFSVFDTHTPHCRVRATRYAEAGRELVRTDIETPAGCLHSIREPAGFTTWTHRTLFSGPEDYPALTAYLDDAVFTPRHDRALELAAAADENTILRTNFGLEPLQHLISGGIFGTLHFCIEWMERRDEVLRLYEILVRKRREIYPMVAAAPVLHANYGGNAVPELVGLEAFRRYYVPHYQEAAAWMHRHGKRIGVHFDANCALFREAIAGTDLDYIEAFTPAPDTDMTLAEARAAWRGKVLWINFPSSVHLRSPEAIRKVTVELLRAAHPGDGFLIGITENLPAGREDTNYTAIMDGIDRYEGETVTSP
ncbi:MAG: hypothetical protein JXR77_03690 [Lentisphaeria bacterium]|nr:hypothetical protein [Lentisphaeria bacterium]